MQLIEISDPKEAQRCRVAQYRGQQATVMANGLPVTGTVYSVTEHHSGGPARWNVAVLPSARFGRPRRSA
jgi:hypothetical protein